MSWFHLVPWWLIVGAIVLAVLFFEGIVSSRALGICAVAGALAFGGYEWGATTMDRVWQAKEDKRLQDEAKARAAETQRSQDASEQLQTQLQQQAINTDQLTKAFNEYKRRYTILARRPVGPALAAAPGQPASAAVPAEEVPAGNDVALSLGAVWMWNSALAGRDSPAGTCGLANASEAACAADAGVTLEDAWDNQALNARICAEDRVRHQALIDFIKGKKK